MPPEVSTEVPVISEVTTQAPVQTQPVETDLMTKVSQFKMPEVKASEIKNAPEQPEFEAIKDPVAKEAAKQAVERLRRGFQSEYDRKLEDANKLVQQSKNWTPQRIQKELLENPEFLQAAQHIALTQNPPNSGLTEEQFSALTDNEKKELSSLKSEINQLKQSNLQSSVRAEVAQRDAQLQSKYADYNSEKINSAFENLSSMNIVDVREHIYKAALHDEHVKAAYEMGRNDARGLNQEKVNAISPNGFNVNNTVDVPTKNKGESGQAFFVRLAQYRLAEHKRK